MAIIKEHYVEPLLEQLQLNVRDLGKFLDMTESNLHHVIGGRRDFTREQLQALVLLDSLVDQGIKADDAAESINQLLNQTQIKSAAVREEKIWALQVKLRKLTKTHSEMDSTFRTSQKAISILTYLLTHASDFSDRQVDWITDQLAGAKYALIKNAPEEQLNMRARIAAMEAELEVLKSA